MATSYTNTLGAYDANRVKESVDDIISNISPFDNPFRATIGRGSVDNTKFEWTNQELEAVAVNAAEQGAEFTPETSPQPTTAENYTQIYSQVVSVSRTAETIAKYGRANEVDYQLGLKAKKLNNDIESSFIGATPIAVTTAVAPSAGTAARTNSIWGLTDASTTTNVAGAIAESDIKDALELAYTQGADVNVCFTPPALTTSFWDGLQNTTGRQQQYQVADNAVDTAVQVYASSLGGFTIVPNRWMDAQKMLFVNPMNVEECVFDDLQVTQLGVRGDSTEFAMVTERGLKQRAAKGSIALTGITG